MCARLARFAAVPLIAVLLARRTAPGWAQVSNADQICAPTADPCIIQTQISVAAGALLNFGSRAVQIHTAGALNVGSGSLSITCGSLTIDTGGAILARG